MSDQVRIGREEVWKVALLIFCRRRELVLRIGHLESVGLAGGQALEV